MSVYANGRAIIHKGDGHRQISGTPDVCKTPSPGGPVPVPYPNIASDSDLAKGSKSVKIAGHTAALKTSNLKTSKGDEAGTAGGGLMSSKTKGKLTWASSSADVRIEGKNSVRFLDICLHNGNMANSGAQATKANKAQSEALAKTLCLHCTKPIGDPSHDHARLDAGDKDLMDAALLKYKNSNNVVGGIKVNGRELLDTTALARTPPNHEVKLVIPRNLASDSPLTIPQSAKTRWAENGGFPVGNCVEQVLLDRAFPSGAQTKYTKETTISMGVAKKKEKPKPKCATCQEVMIAMLCTNTKPKEAKKYDAPWNR